MRFFMVLDKYAEMRDMVNWKKIGKKLLFPPGMVMLLLTVFSAVALVYIFVNGLELAFFAYAIYVVAFYTLTVICIFFSMVLPKRYRQIRQRVYAHPLGNRYMTDVEFKNRVSLYLSLVINLLYTGFNVLLTFLERSFWFGILAGYYGILAIMRFLLVRYIHKNKLGEKRRMELECARICAIILTTLNFVLSGSVLMILYQNRGFEYHGIFIYVMALYTFYGTITTIINLVKYRKYNNPILSLSKIIKMAAALVSMLSLETAMFAQFGAEMSPKNQRIMIAATGGGVSIIVISMAVYVIVRTTKELNEMRRQSLHGQ